MKYHEHWETILEHWAELTENMQNTTIGEEFLPYYRIWDQLSPTQQEFVCRRPDLDLEAYWSFLNKAQKRVVYCFNQELDFSQYWGEMNNLDRLGAIKHNEALPCETLWPRMVGPQRTYVIEHRLDFPWAKYWDELDTDQRTAVVHYHYQEMDLDRYWPELTAAHRVYLLPRGVINLQDHAKLQSCYHLVRGDVEFIERLLGMEPKKESTEVPYGGKKRRLDGVDFKHFRPNLLPLWTLILDQVPMINLGNLESIAERVEPGMVIYLVEDMMYLRFPGYEGPKESWENFHHLYFLTNYRNRLREKKLSRILKTTP